ncbi:MAG: rod shape-determining protein [Hyphomicrobiaceae bacterium]
MLSQIIGAFSDDLAIDLGTANTLVYVPGKGIVLDEPSVVAIRTRNDRREVIAVGAKAKTMIGRSPDGIETVRPLRDGVIADFIAAEAMVGEFIRRTRRRLGFLRPRVLVCVPASSTPVERRAIYESTLAAGARSALLVEEPVAAALGANLPTDEPRGSMVVDIGGGTTDIAVMALGGVLKAVSVRCAGDAMDEAIIRYIRRKYSLLIGEANAERIKIEAGAAQPRINGKAVDVHIRGRDLKRGSPTEIVLKPSDIAEALAPPIETIADSIQRTLEQLPPELAADISDRGICLTGGGSLLDKLDIELERLIGVHFFMAENPLQTVALGCGVILADEEKHEDLLILPG